MAAVAYEIYREEIESYSERSPDLVPPGTHFYAIVYDGDASKGQLRIDVSAYSGDLSFSIEEPDPEEAKEFVTVSADMLGEALGALRVANAAARSVEQANAADRVRADRWEGPG
jgi:hypothetical protein